MYDKNDKNENHIYNPDNDYEKIITGKCIQYFI